MLNIIKKKRHDNFFIIFKPSENMKLPFQLGEKLQGLVVKL